MVIIRKIAYTLKHRIVNMKVMKKVVGFSWGRGTYRNRCQPLAPSSSAASYSSGLGPSNEGNAVLHVLDRKS